MDSAENVFSNLTTVIDFQANFEQSGLPMNMKTICDGIFNCYQQCIKREHDFLSQILLDYSTRSPDDYPSVFIGTVSESIGELLLHLNNVFVSTIPKDYISDTNGDVSTAKFKSMFSDIYSRGHLSWKLRTIQSFKKSLADNLKEMKFETSDFIPTVPSTFLTELLYIVCKEIYRIEAFKIRDVKLLIRNWSRISARNF